MKHVLFTGGTGFLGSFMATRLLKEGYRIIFLARGPKPRERIMKALSFVDPEHPKNYIVLEGDIAHSNFLKNIASNGAHIFGKFKIDECWHCAGFVGFRKEQAEEAYKTNVEGTNNILALTRELKIPRLHHFSTAYVFGDRQGIVMESQLDCGQFVRNPYEATKLQAEANVQQWSKATGIATSIYRPSIVVGDSQSGKTASLTGYYAFWRGFYLLKQKILQRLARHAAEYKQNGIGIDENNILHIPARIPCSPQGTINLATINYIVDTIFKLANHPESNGRIFHIVNQRPPTFEWLFKVSGRLLGVNGFKLVDVKTIENNISLPGVNASTILTEIETQILRASGAYFPYISGEADFDDANVKALLGPNYNHPIIDGRMVETLLKFAFPEAFNNKTHS